MPNSVQKKPDISKANICPPCPASASPVDTLIYWLGIGLGSGLPKRAPGTWGTVAGLLLGLLALPLGLLVFSTLTLMMGVAGSYICGRTSELMGVADDPHIVWDEWVGMWVSLLPVAAIYPSLVDAAHASNAWLVLPAWLSHHLTPFVISLLAFVLFRFFDIVKPPPIGWADKKVAGGFGILLDDVLAGIMTILTLVLLGFVSFLL